jgi:hypothetical protein
MNELNSVTVGSSVEMDGSGLAAKTNFLQPRSRQDPTRLNGVRRLPEARFAQEQA